MNPIAPRSAILFVDDEPNLLAAIRRIMHALKGDYTVVVATSGEEALKLSESNYFDIIVSDMRMPGMDGAELLKRVQRHHPETIRVVLSGQASLGSAVKAISATHQYLAKPCNFDELKLMIRGLAEARGLIESPTVRKHLSRLSALPCNETVLARFYEALDQQTISIESLAQIALCDLGLSAKLFHVALSMHYSQRNEILSIRDALSVLSEDTLRVLRGSGELFHPVPASFQGINLSDLAEHSSAVAQECAKLAERTDLASARYAWLAGYLHDIGKLLIAECFGPLECEIEGSGEVATLDCQRRFLGVTHAEAGAYVLKLWGLNDDVVAAVRDHHSNMECAGEGSSLGQIVRTVNRNLREESGSEAAPQVENLGSWKAGELKEHS